MFFKSRSTAIALFVAAAAAIISAPVIDGEPGGPEPTVVSTSEGPPAGGSSTADVVVVSPFAQDEVVFRSTPGWGVLLLGGSERVKARGLWRDGCDDALAGAGGLRVVRRGVRSAVKAVAVEGANYDPSLPTDSEGDETSGLYPCPVTLTIDSTVSDATSGWLILARKEPFPEGQDVSKSLTEFRISRVISPWGYLLIGLSALAVTGVAWVATAIKRFGKSDTRFRDALRAASPSVADAPVSSAILGALTAVSAGTIAWSGLAPGLDLGGVIVLGLVGGVLVAAGDAIAQDWRRLGNVVALFGLAVIALLLPFVLLHAATVGAAAGVIWVVLLLIVGFTVGLGPNDPLVTERPTGPSSDRTTPATT